MMPARQTATATIFKQTAAVLLASAAMGLAGCWTPPNANVQPAGKPGLIQGGIPLEVIQKDVKVVSLDAAKRTMTLAHEDGTTKTFKVNDQVKNFDALKVGDTVTVQVKARFAVYITDHGQIPNPDGTPGFHTVRVDARILKLDPSYRLVTVQFTSGKTLEVKMGLDVDLLKMAPGDDVELVTEEVESIKIK